MARNLQRDLADPAVHDMDFGTYLHSRGPWCDEYKYNVLLPALATWLTASYEAVMKYPAGGLMQCSIINHHQSSSMFKYSTLTERTQHRRNLDQG